MQRLAALLVKYRGSTSLSQLPSKFVKTVELASKSIEAEVIALRLSPPLTITSSLTAYQVSEYYRSQDPVGTVALYVQG